MTVEDIVELALRSVDFAQFQQRLWDYRREKASADAMSDDIVKRLREHARGPAFHGLSEEAADEIERLREAIVMAANRLDIAVAGNHGDGPACRNCVDIALSYLRPLEG